MAVKNVTRGRVHTVARMATRLNQFLEISQLLYAPFKWKCE